MPRPDVKVPGRYALALALGALVLAAGCGEAEPASEAGSVRVIPPAEPATPASDPAAGVPVTPDGAAEPESFSTPSEPSEVESAPRPATRPRALPREPAGGAVVQVPAEEPVTGAEPVPDRTRPLEGSPEPGALTRTDPGPASPAPDPEPVQLTLAAGALLELEMESALSTEESRAGDRFWATVTEDVLGPDGVVLVPRGSRVRGRVLESRESDGADRPAILVLAPEELQAGEWSAALSATVVEAEMTAEARDSDAETARKVGVGAAAGAVLGKIIGGRSKDALKGAVAGAAVGAAVALTTRDGHAAIGEGARLVIRLDEPLVIR